MIEQRRALLEQEGVLFREPFIESTPRYQTGDGFADLGLDGPVLALLESLAAPAGELEPILYDPPYTHQAEALRVGRARRDEPGHHHRNRLRQDGVVSAADAGQARQRGRPLAGVLPAPAVRALILYPMNALVNDQLGRLRLLLGDPRVIDAVPGVGGAARPVRPLHQPDPLPRGPQAGRRTPAPAAIERFYIRLLDEAGDETSPGPRPRAWR